uniref:Uncharacterized protein n=2 Tax=Aegilops tauschii subsp. strangulata TaxID=200361 RepID=A0A453KRT1_AEGTS
AKYKGFIQCVFLVPAIMTPRNGQMHMHQGPDFFSLLCSMHHLFQSYFAQQNKSISVICISVASSFNCINVPISTTRLPLPPRGGHRAQQRCWHLVHLTHLTLGSLLPCLNSEIKVGRPCESALNPGLKSDSPSRQCLGDKYCFHP